MEKFKKKLKEWERADILFIAFFFALSDEISIDEIERVSPTEKKLKKIVNRFSKKGLKREELEEIVEKLLKKRREELEEMIEKRERMERLIKELPELS